MKATFDRLSRADRASTTDHQEAGMTLPLLRLTFSVTSSSVFPEERAVKTFWHSLA